MSNCYGEVGVVAEVPGMPEVLEDSSLSREEPCASPPGCPRRFPAKPFLVSCVHWNQMLRKSYPVGSIRRIVAVVAAAAVVYG